MEEKYIEYIGSDNKDKKLQNIETRQKAYEMYPYLVDTINEISNYTGVDPETMFIITGQEGYLDNLIKYNNNHVGKEITPDGLISMFNEDIRNGKILDNNRKPYTFQRLFGLVTNPGYEKYPEYIERLRYNKQLDDYSKINTLKQAIEAAATFLLVNNLNAKKHNPTPETQYFHYRRGAYAKNFPSSDSIYYNNMVKAFSPYAFSIKKQKPNTKYIAQPDVLRVEKIYNPEKPEIIIENIKKSFKQGGKMINNNTLNSLREATCKVLNIPYYKKGNKIHIKKENKGKFTDYCGGKVTEECIQRGKRSKNPAIRKRATFAANARKWKHAKGGIFKECILKDQYGNSISLSTANHATTV